MKNKDERIFLSSFIAQKDLLYVIFKELIQMNKSEVRTKSKGKYIQNKHGASKIDRKSTRLNSSHPNPSRMPSSA